MRDSSARLEHFADNEGVPGSNPGHATQDVQMNSFFVMGVKDGTNVD